MEHERPSGHLSPGDPVEEYLDLLYAKLRTTPREGRRILAEAGDHLRQGVADGMAAGLTERQAQEYAISSFGSVNAVVRAHEVTHRRFQAVAVSRDLVLSAWRLAAVGLLAVGASGLVAAVMNTVFGRQFVGGTPSAAGLSPATCRDYLTLWPAAHSCARAAMLETSSDAVWLRVFAGLIGLIVLAGYLFARRWSRRSLPDGFVPTVAVAVFGAAGAGLAMLAVSAPVRGGGGAGSYLSGAIVALAVALLFVPSLRRTFIRQAPG